MFFEPIDSAALYAAIEIEKMKEGRPWDSEVLKAVSKRLRDYMHQVEESHQTPLLKQFNAGVDWHIMLGVCAAAGKSVRSSFYRVLPAVSVEELHADLKTFLDRLDDLAERGMESTEDPDALVEFLCQFHSAHLTSSHAVETRRRLAA